VPLYRLAARLHITEPSIGLASLLFASLAQRNNVTTEQRAETQTALANGRAFSSQRFEDARLPRNVLVLRRFRRRLGPFARASYY